MEWVFLVPNLYPLIPHSSLLFFRFFWVKIASNNKHELIINKIEMRLTYLFNLFFFKKGYILSRGNMSHSHYAFKTVDSKQLIFIARKTEVTRYRLVINSFFSIMRNNRLSTLFLKYRGY